MKFKKLCFLLGLIPFFTACVTKPPKAISPLPQAKQVEWQKMETYAFVHFGPNTFNNREWGYGDSIDIAHFNPKKFNSDQWVETFKKAGLKGVIITAKHHDGFCLFPTKYTNYNISNTPFMDGKGDIVKSLSESCKKYGLKFGVYLSPWDRNNKDYGTPKYLKTFYGELNELLTNYGDLFEVWFDGANGGDGWYGGTKEVRHIDRKTYYNFPHADSLIAKLQPQAVIFSDCGPGCRWVGNENGYAGATNWSFLRIKEVYPGYDKSSELTYGHADGDTWVASECNYSIRPGWFYHKNQDEMVKSPFEIADRYYGSVGHNGTMLINVPPTPEGLISKIDSLHLMQYHALIEKDFKTNIFKGIIPKVSNERGGDFVAKNLTDDNYNTYWATEDEDTTATITFVLPEKEQINRLLLQEFIPLGQRVKAFKVEYKKNNTWLPIVMNEECTTIGYKRILRFELIKTNTLRIRITDARGPLCLNNIEAFYATATPSIIHIEKKKLQSQFFTIPYLNNKDSRPLMDQNDSTTIFIKSDTLLIDLGVIRTISSFYYLPDQSKEKKGLITKYSLIGGKDLKKMDQKLSADEFSNIINNPILQSIYFTPRKIRYIYFIATEKEKNDEPMGIAEIAIH